MFRDGAAVCCVQPSNILRFSECHDRSVVFYQILLKNTNQTVIKMSFNPFSSQHRSSKSAQREQRERAREFASLTQTGEKTALFCLSQHDWKLDIALDNYFANPELYYRESKVVTVDRKKLEAMYNKYRGK